MKGQILVEITIPSIPILGNGTSCYAETNQFYLACTFNDSGVFGAIGHDKELLTLCGTTCRNSSGDISSRCTANYDLYKNPIQDKCIGCLRNEYNDEEVRL